MATSLSATPSASASAVTETSSNLPHFHRNNCRPSTLSFRLSAKPKFRFLSKGLRPNQNYSTVVKAQLNEVAVDGPSNDAATIPTKSEAPAPEPEAKDEKPSSELSPSALATEESVSEFISQVSDLIRLVDSKDIVELELKQLDCEIIIRKKEALPQPPSASPVMMHAPYPLPVMPQFSPAPAPISSDLAPAHIPPGPAPSASTPSPSPPATTVAKSSVPPFKSPIAGTFYKSPAPSAPPFVKVGDKVKKGQVICIVEAMKMMNEIESDKDGTIAEILVDDGKPVSIDMPLLVIA